MSFAILFRLRGGGAASDSINGWFKCLRCFRFFTKHLDELYCYDCVTEQLKVQ